MTTLRNKRKLAAINRYNHEEHPKNNQARDTIVPRNEEDDSFQVSENIEGRVTKKLSSILGGLSKLDEFLLNPNHVFTLEPFRRHPGIQIEITRK